VYRTQFPLQAGTLYTKQVRSSILNSVVENYNIYQRLISYLRYLCFFAHSGVQHILCSVFVLFFFVLLSVSLDCPFLIAPSVFASVYIYQGKDTLRKNLNLNFEFWCLTPLSAIFQLYHGDQF
jgi:hypothetical protein